MSLHSYLNISLSFLDFVAPAISCLLLFAPIPTPVISVAMTDTLADYRSGESQPRTVKPDTTHGAEVTRKHSNSNADKGKKAQPPPPFQRHSNQNGEGGDDSQQGGSDDSPPPPEDSKGPKEESDTSTGQKKADYFEFRPQPFRDSKFWGPSDPSRHSSPATKPRYLPTLPGIRPSTCLLPAHDSMPEKRTKS